MVRAALVGFLGLACLTACGSSGGSGATGSGTAKNGPILIVGYASLGGIHLRDAEGRLRTLTTNERDVFPTWAPDGRRIAFERPFRHDGASHLFVMARDGGNVHQVGQAVTFGDQFSWSPDGTKVVYQGHGGLHVVDVEGTGDRLLLADERARQPTWSPDGKTIVFDQTLGGLKAVPADGGAATTLVAPPKSSGVHLYELTSPAWSPDGEQLAYLEADHSNITADYPGSLVLVDRGGGGRRVVAKIGPGVLSGSDPLAWSPDGTQIAFQDRRGDRMGIWTVSVEGGEPKLLIGDYHYSMPSWGPAGT